MSDVQSGQAVGDEEPQSMEVTFGDLCILRRCLCRIHRFSPGVEGRDLFHDCDQCAELGHWSLIAGRHTDRSTATSLSLRAACRSRRGDMIDILVSHYAVDVNARDSGLWTALHTAMVHGDFDICRRLLVLGAKDVADVEGVHASSMRLDQWARLLSETRKGTSRSFRRLTQSRMLSVLVHGHWEPPASVPDAVEQLVDMIDTGDYDDTPYWLCARVCTTVDKLGAEVMRKAAGTGSTVLNMAAWHGYYSVCRVCIEFGANMDDATGRGSGVTPLISAAHGGHLRCVRLLLEHGARADKASATGITPLLIACDTPILERRVDCVRLLLEHGASVDKARKDGMTPLLAAVRRGYLDCCRLLLESGAAVDKAIDRYGTPLFAASKYGRADCVRLLLAWGAQVNATAGRGATPLYVACERGHLKCARLLLEHGAEVDKARSNAATPLHAACGRRRRHVALLLLEHGADPAARARDGKVPADRARLHTVSDPQMADAMELAMVDRAAAIERLRGMDAKGPK